MRIIEHDPDWHALPAKSPVAIHRLLHRCLEKDPKQRLDSAAVARIEIDEAARQPTPAAQAAGPRRASVWRQMVWAATGAAVGVLVTMVAAGRARSPEIPRLTLGLAARQLPGTKRRGSEKHHDAATSSR